MISRPFQSIHRQVMELNKRTRQVDLSTLAPSHDAEVSIRYRVEAQLACRTYEAQVKQIQRLGYALKYHTNLEFTGEEIE